MSGRELDNVSVATIQDVKLQRFAPLLFNTGPNPLKRGFPSSPSIAGTKVFPPRLSMYGTAGGPAAHRQERGYYEDS
jgi:hypothetical protein